MGGDAKLAAIKTFIVTGRTRQVRGENLVPIEFEIQAELPDRYARRDEFPAQDAGPTVTGFNGDRYIQSPAPQPPPARPGGPPPPTPQQLEAAARGQLAAAKQEFARLMLGVFAASYPSHPRTFGYAGTGRGASGTRRRRRREGPAISSRVCSWTRRRIFRSCSVGRPGQRPRAVEARVGPAAPARLRRRRPVRLRRRLCLRR
jgi:hypothetical protein